MQWKRRSETDGAVPAADGVLVALGAVEMVRCCSHTMHVGPWEM